LAGLRPQAGAADIPDECEAHVAESPSEIVLYHNPRCSKSRAALDLLRGKGIEPHIIEYLKTPPDASALRKLIDRLKIRPEDLVRKGEELYKSEFKEKALSDAQWIEVLARHPILIERPIAVRGDRAVLARPPERVLELI
jgi:arsenate reductase